MASDAASRWTCDWESPRPHVHPLRTPSGALLTVDAPADHPWHHALWSTIKFVDGVNFWEEYDEFGVLRTTDVREVESGVEASIDWVRPDGEVAVHEVRRIVERPVDAAAYALEWEYALTPTTDAELDRTPHDFQYGWGGYSGLTLRGSPTWVDTRLLLDDGSEHDQVRGERSAWCAIDGLADGHDAGAVLVDHPDNDRFPTPWYASNRSPTYGEGWANFVNAAFLWEAPMRVAAGTALRRRQLVVVHDGRWDAARVTGVVAPWLGR